MCKTYADSFWGGDLSSCAGFETLVKRNSDSKKMCQELEEYLKKRSKLELEYSKSLQNLAKCFKQRNEVGVLEKAINTFRAEIEVVSQWHTKAANIFQQQSETVRSFKENQTTQRKTLEEQLQKSQNSKLTQLAKTLQLEKIYIRKCSEQDVAAQNLKDIHNQQVPPKELEKAKNKVTKADEEATKADTAYRGAVKTLESCRIAWEREMSSTCQSIQDLDEKRITFFRQELWLAANTDSDLALNIDNSSESIRAVLENADVQLDIQAFIQMASTGQEHPEPYTFKHYAKPSAGPGSNEENPYSTI